MKLIIAGGRNYKGSPEDRNLIGDLIDKYHITEIVSGGAKGADYFGEQCGEYFDIPVKRFNAEWDIYGKSAGYIRNEKMAVYTDFVHLFPGGRGTAHMKGLALQYCKLLI